MAQRSTLRRLRSVIQTLTGVNMAEVEDIRGSNGQVNNNAFQNLLNRLIHIRANHSLHILQETIAGKDLTLLTAPEGRYVLWI